MSYSYIHFFEGKRVLVWYKFNIGYRIIVLLYMFHIFWQIAGPVAFSWKCLQQNHITHCRYRTIKLVFQVLYMKCSYFYRKNQQTNCYFFKFRVIYII